MISLLLIMVALAGQPLSQDDPLQAVLSRMQAADCSRFEFVSIVDSDIFDSVDSTLGSALVATDGRYKVILGPDEYLQTADTLYSYSRDNDQVTVEPSPAGANQEQITFLTRLEKFYEISTTDTEGRYELVNRAGEESSLPSKMVATLTDNREHIGTLEYKDDNGDFNRIVILDRTYLQKCDESALTPEFAPTTEIINLF